MATLDVYILRQILRPTATALLVALLVLLIERLLRLLDLVLGASGPLKVVLEIMVYLVPHYMSVALPLSLVFGILFGFGRLSRDGELDAFQSAGLSLTRQLRPILVGAFGMMVVAAITVSHLTPYGRYAYQAMVYAITNTAFHVFVRAGVFVEMDGRTFLVQGVRPEDARADKVFVYEEQDNGRLIVITARNGSLVDTEAQGPPLLRLFDGVRLAITPLQPAPEGNQDAPPVGALRFEELRTSLVTGGFDLFRPRGKDERELTLYELWQGLSDPPPGVRRSDIVAEFNVRIVRVLSIPFLPFLAIPLALGRRRSDQFHGVIVGLLILIVYDQILDFGKNMVESAIVEPWIGLWLPFSLFGLSSVLVFCGVASRVPGTLTFDPLGPVARLVAFVVSHRARMERRGS